MNAASVPGRLLPNYFADRYGSLNAVLLCVAVLLVLFIGMLGITSTASIVVFAILYGFWSGGRTSPFGTLFAELLTPLITVFSLFAPVAAVFARDVNEIG
jgi:MFS family permease